jgi:hypothetical protein
MGLVIDGNHLPSPYCMSKLAWCLTLILLGLSLGLGVGCRKKGNDPKVIEAASGLPGAAEIMTAIEKKDFDAVMPGLMKVRQSVTNNEQDIAFKVLTRQVRDKIMETAPNDPKGAQVVATLNAMATGGR